MKSVTINRFDGGVAESRFSRNAAECGISKNFDLTTFPNKMVPFRGLAANTTGQYRIGNIIIASNGLPYGVGTTANNNDNGTMFDKATVASDWAAMTNDTPGATQGSFRLLVEFKSYIYHSYGIKAGGALNDGSAAGIWWTDIADTTSSFQAFTNGKTSISNGVVHPATGYLYVGHDNLIAEVQAVGSGYTDNKLTLPTDAIITCIAPYGNYLAIAARVGSAIEPRSKLFLWDLQSTTWTLSIDWPGNLQVINVLNNVLLGVSLIGYTGYSVDRNGFMVYAYDLGGTPTKIKEVSTERQTSTDPSAQINQNVNLVRNGKFYFSADVVGGSTSPKYYGVWSVARSPISGQWAVTLERGATSDNSETSVLAAAFAADYAWFVHTAIGTVTRTNATSGVSSTIFDATSFYETITNPGMDEEDYQSLKKLMAVRAGFYLPDSTSKVTLKYRKNRTDSWTTAFEKTLTSPNSRKHGYICRAPSAGGQFGDGHDFEFRLDSLGGAEITSFGYDYHTLKQ